MRDENIDLVCRNIQRNLTILAYKLDVVKLAYGITLTNDGYQPDQKLLNRKAREYSPESFSFWEDVYLWITKKPRAYNKKFQQYESIVKSSCRELERFTELIQEKTLHLKMVTRAREPAAVIALLKEVDELYSEVNGTFPTVIV